MSRTKSGNKAEGTKEFTPEELVSIALNEPSKNTITICDKEFILKDFKYKDYMAFIRYLTPLFDAFASKLVPAKPFDLSNPISGISNLNATTILNFCEETLPKMALLVAHNTEPEMTEEELLELVPSPFELAHLVLAQVNHNEIIQRLASFLQLMTPKRA